MLFGRMLFNLDGGGAGAALAGEGTVNNGADAGNGDGGASEGQGKQAGWVENFPEQYREALKGYESIGDFAKAHIDAQTKLKSSIAIPGKEASEDERKAFRSALGVPDTPEGYKLPDVPRYEGQSRDAESDKRFLDFAHKLGLNNIQASELYKQMAETHKVQHEARINKLESTKQASIDKLKETWAADYDKKAEIAGKVDRAMGITEALKADGFEHILEVSPTLKAKLLDFAPLVLSDDGNPVRSFGAKNNNFVDVFGTKMPSYKTKEKK